MERPQNRIELINKPDRASELDDLRSSAPRGRPSRPQGDRVPPDRITAIRTDERGVIGDTAIRLAMFFKISAECWTNLQMARDLGNAEGALPAEVRKRIERNRSEPAS